MPSTGYTEARDDTTGPPTGWWFKTTSEFASSYAKSTPNEDFAESFAAFFSQRAGWTFYKGTGASAIPTKIGLFNQWLSRL